MTKQFSNYSDLLTFTRASKGHALRPVSYGTELVENGGFDTDSDWTLSTGATISGGVLTIDYTVGTNGAAQTFSVTAGKVYQVSINVSGSGSARISFAGETVVLDNGNNLYSFVAINTSEFRVRSHVNFSGTIDNISVKEVTFDQPDGTLTLFEHPNNVPRVEYDADGNRLGLLVEEQRTNLITYSEDFSNSYWTKTNANVTAADYGYKITEDSSNGVHRIYALPTVSNSTDYSFSVYVKPAERTKAFIRFGGQNNVYAVVDLENGTVVEGSLTPTITEAFDGFYKISVTHTTTSTTFAPNIGPVADSYTVTNGEPRYQGDGASGIIAFGAQLEAGSFPTSYIKSNSGSTTTRSADVASIPVADFGFNANEGTLFVNCLHFGDASERPLSMSDGSSTNQAFFKIATGSDPISQVVTAGVNIAQLDTTSARDSGYKAAMTVKENDFAVSVDGNSVAVDTAGGIGTYSIIHIGRRQDGLASTIFNGHIKSIKYYPRRLTNVQLQALTEPRSDATLSLTFDGLESSFTENYIHG